MSALTVQPEPSTATEAGSQGMGAGNANITNELAESDHEKLAPPPAFGSDAPDGGFRAWLVIGGAWCTSFCSFGWLNSLGVFQEYYQEHLLRGYSSSTIAWIPSLESFFMIGMGPVVGLIYDNYGPRMLLLVGSFLHVFGIMMTSLGTEYYQIMLAQSVCSAIGASCIFQPAVNCAMGWFTRKRGFALGVLFTGSSLGGIVFPILISRLIDKWGFPWAMRTGGFLVLFLLIIANLTVKPLHTPKAQPLRRSQLFKPLQEANFLLIMIGFFCITAAYFVPVNYLPLQASAAGMSPSLSQYLLSILNAGSLFGRLFAGFVSDRVGKFNTFITVCYISSFWIFALWIPANNDAGLIAFAVLIGFFSGAYVSLTTPMMLAVGPFEELGYRVGIVLLVSAIAGLTANPIGGAIAYGAGGWTGLKVWSGVFFFGASSFVLLVRLRLTKWKVAANF